MKKVPSTDNFESLLLAQQKHFRDKVQQALKQKQRHMEKLQEKLRSPLNRRQRIENPVYRTEQNFFPHMSPIKRVSSGKSGLYSSTQKQPVDVTIDQALMDISKIENKLLQFLSRDFKENHTARERYHEEDQPRASVPVPIPENSASKQGSPQTESTSVIESTTIKTLKSAHDPPTETPQFENELLRREVTLPKPKTKSEEFERKREQLEQLIAKHVDPLKVKITKKKMQHIQEDPSSVSILINLTTAFLDVDIIKRVINKYGWRYSFCNEGDILWTTQTVTQQVAQVYGKMRISRIPGMRQLANKKSTTLFLSKFQEYFPKHYDFFPRTYTMPEDFADFHRVFKDNKDKQFIAKPDKGTQGIGIFIVKQLSQLFIDEQIDMNHIKRGLVIQEYIQKPLLIDQKKFDLRLYALVTSLSPLIVYINDEGLARFCTEDYQEVTNDNASNTYMHLTNYSLNKENNKFIHHPPDFMGINNASKRTFTSAKKSLQKMNVDVGKLRVKIEQVISKFMVSMQPFLLYNTREIYQDRWQQARCFHILGFDILIDDQLQPWILEVNANPSLNINQEFNSESGKQVEVSELDLYVKSRVVQDAFLLVMKEPQDQLQLIKRGQNFNSYRLMIDGNPHLENVDLFDKMLKVFGYLSGHKFGSLNGSKFSRLSIVPKLINEDCMKSDFDLVFKKVTMKHKVNELNYSQFVEAVEILSEKLLHRKLKNYSKQIAVIWVVDRAYQYFEKGI